MNWNIDRRTFHRGSVGAPLPLPFSNQIGCNCISYDHDGQPDPA